MSTTEWSFPGSRWWKFDFHTHTPASSDYGSGAAQLALKQRTTREWLQDFIAAGIECVAVTDHNCGDWIDPLKTELEAMQTEGVKGADNLYLFPGVELTITGAHYLAIFDPSATTRTIQDLLAVARCNGAAKNAEAFCTESVGNICAEVVRLGGLFIPAHLDEERTGAFRIRDNNSALDPILKLEAVHAMEVRDAAYQPPELYSQAQLRWTRILGSDSHHPTAPSSDMVVPRPSFPGSHFTWVKMAKPSLDALRLALIDGNGISILRNDEKSESELLKVPEDLIEEIEVHDARYMGRGSPETLRFSPWLNALVGGRGSGKSTVLQFLRLVLNREDELLDLPPESAPHKEFERFRRVSRSRSDDGAVKAETRIRATYRHQGARYRISWSPTEGQRTVEVWDEDFEEWGQATSQEVKERFPGRLFSQGQIAALAGERSESLMGLINQAVNYGAWKERWDDQERAFFTLRTRIRELEGKLHSRDRIVGLLDDVRRKLQRFEAAEHSKVLKDFQQRGRQVTEVSRHVARARDVADRLNSLVEGISPLELTEGVFDQADPLIGDPVEAIDRLRNAIAATAGEVAQAAAKLEAAAKVEEVGLSLGEWQDEVTAIREAYERLVRDLNEQGVQDPSEYGKLVLERQKLEADLSALDTIQQTLSGVSEESYNALHNLSGLRREISVEREDFLNKVIADNPYVRIELERYGRDPFASRDSLREVLGISDNPGQFEADIFRRDDAGGDRDQGVIAFLLQKLPAEGASDEMERRLAEIRDGLIAVATGEEWIPVGGHLRNRLVRYTEERPEFLDRIITWFPEDSLSVTYSPRGDGKDFRSIQQGSAGQRAAAMLAFLLAYGKEPIIVDQPEDDLDNQLIYQLVVKQIRANKQHRQIIAVTHNPNIVVNGDAEMVHALDFKNSRCLVTKRGSLQDVDVRSEICRVMEGGDEAFELRYRRVSVVRSALGFLLAGRPLRLLFGPACLAGRAASWPASGGLPRLPSCREAG